MEMEEVAAEVAAAGLHPFSTSQRISSTQLPRLIQAVLGAALAQETGGRPGWLPLPPGPPSAHPEPTAGPWARRYYGQTSGFMCVCVHGWMDGWTRKDLTSVSLCDAWETWWNRVNTRFLRGRSVNQSWHPSKTLQVVRWDLPNEV